MWHRRERSLLPRGLGIQGSGPTRAVENNADKKKKLIYASLKTNSNTDYTKCNVGRNKICDNKLKMLLLIARSIVKMEKRLELQAQAKVHGYKIIAVTESWATPDISDGELALDGFTLFHKDRNVIRDGKGEGVLLYVSDELKCVAIDNLNALKCESLWVELCEDPRASVTLGVCYRSPTAPEEEIKNMFTAITQASKERCLIVGDFNYPTINWKNFKCSKEEEEFVDLLHDNFMFQYVDVATREGNILDLVISNEISMVEEIKLLEHFSTSDHNMVEFQLVLKTGVCDAVIYKYDFVGGDYNAIKRALTAINWSETFQDIGTLDCYSFFTNKLNELISCHIPVKKFKTKKKCLWLSRTVKKAIKKKEIKSGSCIVVLEKIPTSNDTRNVVT